MAYIITAVGAGGKTTYLKCRAQEYLRQGKRAAMTTTTHIWAPRVRFPETENAFTENISSENASTENASPGNAFSEKTPPGPDYFGRQEASGKLAPLDEETFARICREYDVVLVEGDGSHCMPVKIPGKNEPVIPPDTDEIVVVMGAHAIGRRLDVVCHRYEGSSRETVTEQMLEEIAEQYYIRPLRKKYPKAQVRYVLSRMPQRAGRTACVLMASGFGRRYGGNKLLDLFHGKPLYRHCLDHVAEAMGRENAIVVTQYEEIMQQTRALGIAAVWNDQAGEGISASIRLGTKSALAMGADAVMFFAADMPFLPAVEIRRFARQFSGSGTAFGCMEFGKEHITTNPGAFLLKAEAEKLLQLRGDRGAMRLMKQEPWKVYYYQIAPEYVVDVDVRT